MKKVPDRNTQRFYSNQGQVVEETNGAGTTTEHYVWSPVYVDEMLWRKHSPTPPPPPIRLRTQIHSRPAVAKIIQSSLKFT